LKNSVHQFVSSISPRDAVGNIVIATRDVLRGAGYTSEIFAESVHEEMKDEAKHFTKYNKKNSKDILVYHHSFESSLVDYLLPLKNKIILIYHNITPSHFFIGLDDSTIKGSVQGRKQLDTIRTRVEVGIAFSKYSEEELKRNGFKNTVVMPPIFNLNNSYTTKNNAAIYKDNDYTNILSVGRIVPHKKVEDILKIFSYYNKCINNKSRLHIVGKYETASLYYRWLQNIVSFLELENVNFLTDVSNEELMSYYKNADLYLSMSEHEGFCLPLLESMYHGVPILAYAAAAIPETLGNSGILVKEKKFAEIAEIIHLIMEDHNLRDKIVKSQLERLKALDLKFAASQLLNCLDRLEG